MVCPESSPHFYAKAENGLQQVLLEWPRVSLLLALSVAVATRAPTIDGTLQLQLEISVRGALPNHQGAFSMANRRA